MAIERPDHPASVARIERGLYVFRYVDSPCDPCPMGDVRALEGAVEIVAAPGRQGGRLDGPGQALVIVAHESATIEVRVAPARPGGGTDANFNLDVVDGGEAPGASAPGTAEVEAPGDAVGLDILAHVARRGDVRVGAGDWVAGPDDVLPIEGLAIATDRRDVAVLIRVQSVGGGEQWSRWYGAGEFAGSRQRADPLTAIGLALSGEGAAAHTIEAEVMPLGGSMRSKSGREVEFAGFDPIVGFRASLRTARSAGPSQIAPPASRLRIFRAKR